MAALASNMPLHPDMEPVRDDDIPSSKRLKGGQTPAPEGLLAEISALREEARQLRARQDQLETKKQEDSKSKSKKKKDDDDDDDKKDDDNDGGDDGGDDESKDEKKPPVKERLKKQIHEHPVRSAIIALVAVGAIVGGILFYLHTRTYEDTDDAQIDADISAVSPRVSGTVVGVYVVDNQVVHVGDVIADLDPADLDIAVQQAEASLRQAEAQLATEKPNVPLTQISNSTQISTTEDDVATVAAEVAAAERDYEQVKSQIDQADANNTFAQVERDRMVRLATIGAVATTQSDQRVSQAAVTAATVESMRRAAEASKKRVDEQRARLASAQQKLEQAKANAPKQIEQREASVKLNQAAVEVARARLDEAKLNRSYAHIVSPVDGVVGKKSVNVGDRVQPGQQLAAITQTDHMWVTANFRETQLEKMYPNQHVGIHVDAIDMDFAGYVESMPGATGAKYSLLPPENATGNYVKVVQRLPVRIKLDKNQKGWERLRPGMSVEPKVHL